MNDARIDRALAAAPVAPLPGGFRDAVMQRLSAQRSRTWELVVALALALPSLAYVAWVLAAYRADFVDTLGDLVRAAQGADAAAISSPTFFIDGLIVLAMALLGLASIVAAHALLGPREGRGPRDPRVLAR